MKKFLLVLTLLIINNWVFGCPLCDKQQPKVLRGISHGAGPQSQWDYVIVWIGVFIVLFTLFYSLKLIIRPGEKSLSHIKQHIFNPE